MIGPEGEYVKGICKSCSTQRKVTRDEFVIDGWHRIVDGGRVPLIPRDVDQDVLEYVAVMRSWNCCYEGEEPLDGLPEQPDVSQIEFE
ncbi:hypothetical protein HUG10_20870 (plasmid) [Halorarum halophilum]|uniref:Uncharacterized protein n=1 Tax=Halorarum halophilum TaxID=2743090 RepID=A0A7D5H025_9EURY|nr:hypothetical protein [Halobaculum halophilum]QLG30049.1 hypothetical protein HUG10_20870 [Halobaculum halophilum]